MIVEYRKKKAFANTIDDRVWERCTELERKRIEEMSLGRFEFRERESPQPTPSMKKAAKKAKKEDNIGEV